MNKIIAQFFLLVFYLFFAFKTNAQQFKIIAAEDGAALPYATLINYTHPNLVSANVNGMAQLAAQVGDSIAVSYVGFKNTSFIFNSNTDETIHLFKETGVLSPITIINCKKMKQFKYSNKDSILFEIMENGNRNYFAGVAWDKGAWNNPQWAVRLNPEKENAILKNFSFWLEKPYAGPKSAIAAPLIISFYDVADSALPGNVLIESPIIYFPQKTGKQTLNLDSLHLRIPPNGIYVSFQCVMNEEYAWTEIVKWKDSTHQISKDTIFKRYGGRIDGVYTRNFDLAWFNPIKNKWFLFSKKSRENDLHGSIKCEAVLKYCVD